MLLCDTHSLLQHALFADASPSEFLESVHGPNDDTLNALIVFSMLESQNQWGALSLKDEIAALQTALEGYRPRVTNDPLGWGLEALFDQYVEVVLVRGGSRNLRRRPSARRICRSRFDCTGP